MEIYTKEIETAIRKEFFVFYNSMKSLKGEEWCVSDEGFKICMIYLSKLCKEAERNVFKSISKYIKES